MERQEIEIFLALAEELHFGKTADKVGVSQGRVSQTISRLERRIGARLFERSSRRVELTAIGRQLRDEIGPAHGRIKEAIARATAAGRGIDGTLRIGFSGAFTGHLLHAAAASFNERHPAVEISILQVQISDPFGRLRAGDVDLQVTEPPVREEDLTQGPVLLSQPRVLIVSTTHPFAGRSSVTMEDLAESTLLTVAGPVPSYWLDHHFPRETPSGRPIPHGQAIVHWEDALSLVLAGKGVTPVSAAGVRYYARPGLTFLPLSDAPRIEYACVWPTQRLTSRVRTFVTETQRYVAERGGPRSVLESLWASESGT